VLFAPGARPKIDNHMPQAVLGLPSTRSPEQNLKRGLSTQRTGVGRNCLPAQIPRGSASRSV
jgi:hypothetical protein